MKKTLLTATATLLLLAASALTASADSVTISSGDIYAIDPAAADYGARSDSRTSSTRAMAAEGEPLPPERQQLSGSATGSDGRARVQGDPLWTVGGAANSFWFEYRPVVGATDLILSGATDRSSPGFSRVITDPLKTVNFISFYIQSNEGAPPTTDNITVNLTGPRRECARPRALVFGYPPGGSAKWYLTDPTLLSSGFKLSGNIVLTAP